MTDIKSMTQQELSQFLKELGEPAFRAKQVFTWLHRGAASFDEMTNLSKSLREKLKGRCFITAPVVARKQESRLDGTIKYLWELSDGNCIETVLMQYHHGNTVCISSQVGCRMGCALDVYKRQGQDIHHLGSLRRWKEHGAPRAVRGAERPVFFRIRHHPRTP